MGLYRFLGIPEPKFKVGELVVINREAPSHKRSCGEMVLDFNGRSGRYVDYLFHINSREYKKCADDTEKKWYYSGNRLQYKPTTSKSLTQVPVYSTGTINQSEDSMRKLEDILVKEN